MVFCNGSSGRLRALVTMLSDNLIFFISPCQQFDLLQYLPAIKDSLKLELLSLFLTITIGWYILLHHFTFLLEFMSNTGDFQMLCFIHSVGDISLL